MKRLAFFITHPTQYHSPWFRALANRPELEIHVYYGCLPNAEQQGTGFGVNFQWDIPLLDGYPNTILENTGTGSISTFNGVDAPAIERVIGQGRYDAWVINGWRTRGEWRAIKAAYRAGAPMFIRGDSTLLDRRSMPRRLAKHFLHRRWIPRFACYYTVGRLNEEYYKHYGADSNRFVPVRHFVDNDAFSSADPTAVERMKRVWQTGNEPLILLFAGKFIPKKQPMDAIRAVEESLRAGANVKLVMVGDGPLRAECESYAMSKRLPVTFAGFLNQQAMPAAYAAADVLVVPSVRDETWGLVVNEAMAAGTPAIVSDMVGCAPDLVICDKTGSIFPAGDVARLSGLITTYAADPHRAEREGKQAALRIQDYSLRAAVENTIKGAELFAA